MREFSSQHSGIGGLSLPAKILYTAFSTLTLCGLINSVLLYDDFVQFGARSTPAELYSRLLGHYSSSMDRQRLLEVTHAHLFSVPVLLLVAGHLFLLTSASRRAKLFFVGAGAVGVATHLAAPWVIHLGGGGYGSGLLYPITGALMTISMGYMLGMSTWDMWRKPAREPRRAVD